MRKIVIGLIVVGLVASPLFMVSFDGDSTPAFTEMVSSTSVTSADTDNDSLSDTVEISGETSATNPDTDSDDLEDGEEAELGTNPLVKDTNGDGINDGVEVKEYGTNPTLADTDGDGLNESTELDYGSNPTVKDSDGDGINDGLEVRRGTDPVSKQDCSESNKGVDTDKDGLSDFTECRIGTDPAVADTDKDGLTDKEEYEGVAEGGVEIPNSNPTHMDLYVTVVLTDGTRLNTTLMEEFFRNTDIQNPNGSSGIVLHVETVRVDESESFKTEEDYQELADEYQEEYSERGVYSTVVVAQKEENADFVGYGESPGDFSIVGSQLEYVAIHEVLHSVLGAIDGSECSDEAHVCSQNGIMNVNIRDNDRKLSEKTRTYINEKGFVIES